ncbi:MAG: hypothetical protein SPK23_07300 [Eubacteriales bacterium]|nr:hypothetical protein [Clostridiales bacterium]MDY5836898.1 hypothetical protein [Eubacteriales bacterium]
MYRKEIISYTISTLCVFAAATLHLLSAKKVILFPVHIIIFCLYTLVICLWRRNMKNRMLRAATIAHFRLISYLLVSYLALRTLKYEILLDNPLAIQHIRYGYYVCSLNIVQLIFFTALMIAKSERESMNKLWNLLWIPTEILVALIVSNDFHKLAFDVSEQGVHQYGPVFYAVLIYISILAIALLILTLIPSFASKQFKPIFLPVLILLVWALYTFLYIFDWQPFQEIKLMFTSTEFNILAAIMFTETLVFTRLIPSNRGYERFLKMSTMNIGIMDYAGRIIVEPKEGASVSNRLIREALTQPVFLDENTQLESAEIQGGYSFWFVDLKELNQLKAELYALNEDMLSEHDLLLAHNKLAEKMAKLGEQEEIRSYIDNKLSKQFHCLESIINQLPSDQEAFEKALKHASIYNVYIKRYANLFLLSKNQADLPLAELSLAFAESLDYLGLSGVETQLDWQSNASLPAGACLQIYEIFQTILERHFVGLKAISVNLHQENQTLKVAIQLKASQALSVKELLEEADDRLSLAEDMIAGRPIWQISVEGGRA